MYVKRVWIDSVRIIMNVEGCCSFQNVCPKFLFQILSTDAIEKRGIKPIQEILDRTGGWPVAMPFDKWDPDKTRWQRIDKEYMILIGNSAFYNLEYEIDLNNTKRYVLTVRYEMRAR